MAHAKSTEGYDVKIPSQGQVTYNTVAGSAGLAAFLGLGNNNGRGILGNLLGGGGTSPADQPVTRYEMAMQQELAAKDSRIALLEANTYNDQKSLELYKEFDRRYNELKEILAAQAVTNVSFNKALESLDFKTMQAIALEAERRECADCKIVNYVNSTFTPKLVTDYAAGTASAAAAVYNPLACGTCGCGN